MNEAKKLNLEKFCQDIETKQCIEIALIWNDGTKSGIGNKDAIEIAISTLKLELQRQINNC